VGSANGTESLRSLVQSVKSEAERNAIVEALQKTGGNRKAAAGLLRVSYRTLLYKIEQYQLKSPDTAVLPRSNGHNGNGRAD
jgi:two-component system response regulator AtoC